MVTTLLIDFDGVLRFWDSQNNCRAEELTGVPLATIHRVAFTHDILLPAITGQITDDEWRTTIVDRLRTQFPHHDVVQAVDLWSASPGSINPAVLDCIRRCRQQVTVVLVTNATSRLPQDLARLSLTEEFDHIVNSSAVGAAKPDPAIFHAALRAANGSVRETLFVDDSAGHVLAATQLGMHGHVYEGSEQLNNVLREHGVGGQTRGGHG